MAKIRISLKKLTEKRLIYIQIVYNCFIKWGISQFGLPSSLNYVSDIITVLLFIEILFHRMNGYIPKKKIAPTNLVIALFVYSVLDWLMHLYSPIYFAWGLRNTFRFYVFFTACTTFLEKEDIPKIINIIFYVLFANLIMCTYQYFMMEKHQDLIAGFLGSVETQGGNGPMVVLLCIASTIAIVQYIESRKNTFKLLVAVVGTLYIATIAELKALYILLVIIFILSSLFTKFSVKKLLVVILALVAFPIAIKILYSIYPNFENFFDWETIVEYAGGEQGYTGRDDINRFSAIQYCFDNFLETPFQRIFGFGLGAADGSLNFDVVTTEFFKENYKTHYTWFSVSMVLIELGMFGLIMYWMFFVLVIKDATKLRRNKADRPIIIISQILPVLMIMFSFLSAAMRTETIGYLCYAFLAFPYVIRKQIT